jgi:multidrug efflux system outer membrane protein
LEISEATLKSFEDSRKLVVKRFEGGVVSRQDVAQINSLVHTAGARIADLKRQIGQQEDRICLLLGLNPQPVKRGKPLTALVVRATVPAGLPSDLLERRPDIRQTEEVLVAANYRIGAARAEFFPRINLTGLFGAQSVELSDLFTGPAKIWSIGPSVTLPIFTGGRHYFNLQSTWAQQEQALILYQFSVRQAFREVADGLIGHSQLRDFRQEQEALVKSDQDYAQLANVRYKGGMESFLAVLDADRQLFAAQLDLAAVQRDQLLTIVQLYKALGGGWEPIRQPPDNPIGSDPEPP